LTERGNELLVRLWAAQPYRRTGKGTGVGKWGMREVDKYDTPKQWGQNP